MQRQEVDLYLRGLPDYFHEDWIKKSNPIQFSSAIVCHAIFRDQNSFLNLLDNFNFGLTLSATYMLSFCAVLVICFLIHQISHRLQFGKRGRTGKAVQKTVAALGSFRGNRLSTIGVFVLCTHVFLWLTQLFLTNNIKTNKVVKHLSTENEKQKTLKNFVSFRWSIHRN